jgi:hypothetical protein
MNAEWPSQAAELLIRPKLPGGGMGRGATLEISLAQGARFGFASLLRPVRTLETLAF